MQDEQLHALGILNASNMHKLVNKRLCQEPTVEAVNISMPLKMSAPVIIFTFQGFLFQRCELKTKMNTLEKNLVETNLES